MVHGDNRGLVLPPRVAPLQAVIIFIYASADGEEMVSALSSASEQLERALKAAGVRAKVDPRDNYGPGWKFAHWEQKVTHTLMSPTTFVSVHVCVSVCLFVPVLSPAPSPPLHPRAYADCLRVACRACLCAWRSGQRTSPAPR